MALAGQPVWPGPVSAACYRAQLQCDGRRAINRWSHGRSFCLAAVGLSVPAAAAATKAANKARAPRRPMRTQRIDGIAALVDAGYDGFMLDQYGVLHDGKQLLPGAQECLAELQQRKIALSIVSNSPCESNGAAVRLKRLGLEPQEFCSFFTSGDLVKRHLQKLISEAAPARLRCLFISHEDHCQRGTWSPDELRTMGLELVATVEDCDFILANGVQVCNKGTLCEIRSSFESDASWDVFGPVLQSAANFKRPLIIANPDTVIHRSDGTALKCPGCFAKKYSKLGGNHLYVFGKPGRDIFTEAAEALGRAGATQICHVGDSLVHDVGGAAATGIDSVLVEGGIHQSELRHTSVIDLCDRKGVPLPTFLVPSFKW